jgi:CRP/FNR family transcriptional regulator, cyclic AMP receptor protein
MSEIERIIPLLAASPLFGSAEPEALQACAAGFRRVDFTKNEMLFGRGDPADHIYIVLEGRVRLSIATAEGRELSFQIAGPGDLFGEIGVLDGAPRSAEATAVEATIAYRLEKPEFHRLRCAHPSVSDSLILFLCRRLRVVSDKLEIIVLYSLEARLARFLLTALEGLPETPGRRVPLTLGYSQSELAQLLGASRPKLNAALGSLEKAGAIKRTQDRLFCDRAQLQEIAESEGR